MKIILCGADLQSAYRKKLENYADRVACMPEYPGLSDSTSTHPDMLGYAAGDRLFLSRGYYLSQRAFFDALGCVIVPCDVTYGKYPRDVYFNVFALEDALFGRTDVTPAEIRERYNKCIYIKQGYAKCSTVLVGRGAVTADRGIALAVAENGGEALPVSPEGVTLRGYPRGFIGGAVAVPDGGTILPFGDLLTHPDGQRIADFAAGLGFSLDNGAEGERLSDCGGILILDV